MLKWFAAFLATLAVLGLAGFVSVMAVFYYFGRDLPDYQQLADYEPPVVTRVHAGDGSLIAEYATQKRVFVPVDVMPKRVIKAFLAAEDKKFYSHPGVDILRVIRAAITNLRNIGQNRRPVGASTITQQVAKNFLLSNEVSIERKIKEAILALRIEHAFTKGRILELYLNEIYLGLGSYGVAAAALNYFDKPLDELTLGEAAYLAALPKAPNNYHPVRRPAAAKARRDWVIGRLASDGFISKTEAEEAKATPLIIRRPSETRFFRADFFAEEVRRELLERYGEKGLYGGGLSVRTTVEPRLQEIADKILRQGLIVYDRRHGWRGPIVHIDLEGTGVIVGGTGPVGAPAAQGDTGWLGQLAVVPPPEGLHPWRLAVVLAVGKEAAEIGLDDGSLGRIPLGELKWARPWRENQRIGRSPRAPGDVLSVGDVIAVEAVSGTKDGKATGPGTFALRQIPNVNGALIALDPHTGRVLAMTGGFSFEASQFNRATQAMRQAGSAFKPFVYLTALGSGFTPSSLILDAPFVIDQGPGLGRWKPANYTKKFYGPSTMRLGLEKSRNLMTVRLAQTIGIEKVASNAERLNIVDAMPRVLSMALGAGETTLLRLTTAYAMLVNGGKRITPTLIDRIQDRHGRTVFRHDRRRCPACRVDTIAGQEVPEIPDIREQVADARSAYQVVSMLQGVVKRGTGRRVRAVGKPMAGKTGTTNDGVDTWFIGFSPDLAAGVFVGFDTPRTLGRRETGSSVAAPIFRDFMKAALADQPAIPFRIPPGIRLVRVNATTGLLARRGDRNVILEAFKPGTEPTGEEAVLDGSDPLSAAGAGKGTGTSGLY
ncbi:MAG: penicillin-binding protein 1A [Proteobacteria bacterium]|nr:penicillin-binding protein 1A [Pseudomonadota bacterium]